MLFSVSQSYHLRIAKTQGYTSRNCEAPPMMHREAPNDPKTFHRGKSHQQKVFWPFLGPIINPWKSQSDHFLLVKSFFLGEKIPSTPRLPGNAKSTTEWVGNTQNTSRYGEEIGVPF